MTAKTVYVSAANCQAIKETGAALKAYHAAHGWPEYPAPKAREGSDQVTTTATVKYLSAVETAKLVRKALAAAFPGVKFSVKSDITAIRVKWVDGPLQKAVQAVAGQYKGGGFDGMIDLAYDWTSWLAPDGTAGIAKSAGTTGSVYPIDNMDAVPAGAELVRFGARYVFCNREISDFAAKRADAAAWIGEHCTVVGEGPAARFGSRYVSDLATSIVYLTKDGEGWADGFARATGPVNWQD